MMLLETVLAGFKLEPTHIGFLVGFIVFTLAIVVARGVRAREEIGRRATAIGPAGGTLDSNWQDRANRMVERAAIVFKPGDKSSDTELRRQLIQAGFFSPMAPAVFSAIRLAAALLLPIGMLLSLSLLQYQLPVVLIALGAMCMALVGLVLPSFMLDFRITAMQQRYRHAFPDMMDLLVVCVESGQSLQSAIAQVSRELMTVCPPLGFNLHLVSLELRAGSTLDGALFGLHGRIGLDEVKSLAVLLKQSAELGASIAGTLRVFSDEMRDKRLIRAETKANMLPVKMTVPLGLLIFPVIILVIMVPVVIRIKNSFV